MTPKVSLVITTLDRLGFLEEAVASVRAQAGPAFELIVVDNGSSDGTPEWLTGRRELVALAARRDPNRSRSGNISHARNVGFAQARGDYVWFLDDDDRLRPGAIEALAAALDEHPDAAAAVGARMRFGEGIAGGRIAHPLRRVVARLGPELLLGWGWVPSMAMIRASVLRDAGGWREDVARADDIDLWVRIGWRAPIVLEPATVVDYRIHHAQLVYGPVGSARDELVRPYLARLAGGDERRGLRLRAAGRRWERAINAFDSGDYRLALRATLAAAVRAPLLLRSPATGPIAQRMIVRSALRCWGPTRRWVESRPPPAPSERPRRGVGFLS